MKVTGKEYFVYEFRLGGNWQRVCLEKKFDEVNDLFDYIKENIVSVEDGYNENGMSVLRFFLNKSFIISCADCNTFIEFVVLGRTANIDCKLLFEEYRKTLDKE